MRMKIVGIFLVTVILLSYVPMIPLDDCPGANHMGKYEDGLWISIPLSDSVDLNISETSVLPLTDDWFQPNPCWYSMN